MQKVHRKSKFQGIPHTEEQRKPCKQPQIAAMALSTAATPMLSLVAAVHWAPKSTHNRITSEAAVYTCLHK